MYDRAFVCFCTQQLVGNGSENALLNAKAFQN